MQARITGAIARIVARHPGGIVVAVSHADPIKAAVAHALGTPLDLFQRIMIGTASITAIAYRPLRRRRPDRQLHGRRPRRARHQA